MATIDLVAKFEKNQLAIEKLQKQIEQAVASETKKLAKLQERDAEMREAIKQAMAENNIKKFDSDLLTITYVAPTVRNTFDSKRFAEERPRLYKQYVKQSDVKDSIRLKIKA